MVHSSPRSQRVKPRREAAGSPVAPTREQQTARVLGEVLLALNCAAREAGLADFPRQALEQLRRAIPFEFAWWGTSRRQHDRQYALHTSFSIDAPTEYVSGFDQINNTDEAGAASALAPRGIAHHYLTADLPRATPLARLLRRSHIEQVLLITLNDLNLGLANFLGLYRYRAKPAFSATDRLRLEVLMPHLVESRNNNWIASLDGSRGGADHGAMAVADKYGVVHSASARFQQRLRSRWPDWHGPKLPAPLLACATRCAPYEDDAFVIRAHEVNGLLLLELQPRSPLEALTARERLVAEQFGSGRSNKHIATCLSIAPATVRHHLRNVYRKLGVCDKAQLAGIVFTARGLGRT